MHQACEQGARWHSKGLEVPVAVNYSARQLQHSDPVGTIKAILKDTGFPASSLELELTESTVMADPELAKEAMREIHSLGVRLAIDDFGTGYSSLAALKRFPLEKLKIDRLFISSLTADANDLAITTAIIALAHSLNLHPIAEGVETKEQVDTLTRLHCRQMQGFLFSRPVEAAAATALLRSRDRLTMATRQSAVARRADPHRLTRLGVPVPESRHLAGAGAHEKPAVV
jgi:EAL domain-containing protein (putative c-di-GMP-specific phosphodiesterase class I)